MPCLINVFLAKILKPDRQTNLLMHRDRKEIIAQQIGMINELNSDDMSRILFFFLANDIQNN